MYYIVNVLIHDLVSKKFEPIIVKLSNSLSQTKLVTKEANVVI